LPFLLHAFDDNKCTKIILSKKSRSNNTIAKINIRVTFSPPLPSTIQNSFADVSSKAERQFQIEQLSVEQLSVKQLSVEQLMFEQLPFEQVGAPQPRRK
jgi:hypothetical protein